VGGSHIDNLAAASELLVGFVIVMMTLVLLWGLTALMGRIVGRFESRAPRKAVPAAASAPAAVDDDEEIAVVAAAVALMLDVPHRVVQVRPRPSAWAHQGRDDLHGSHRIR
jgi:sodium pump decarboxylase gamma subunit